MDGFRVYRVEGLGLRGKDWGPFCRALVLLFFGHFLGDTRCTIIEACVLRPCCCLLFLVSRAAWCSLQHFCVGCQNTYSHPQVDRIWGIWDLIIIYPEPYSIYLRRAIAVDVNKVCLPCWPIWDLPGCC